MNNDRSQGGRGEVLSVLISPTIDENRKSIHTTVDRASVRSSQYDQVSSGDILRRFREQGTQRKQSTATNVVETAQEAALKAEAPRSEDYVIEVPKSGMQDKDEYVIPLFLPTVCSSKESEQELNEEEVSEEHKKSNSKPIRTLVYCEDDVVFADYLEEHNLQGATKPLWGLQFDSKFESGNLYKAESVQHRGAPLGAPEEYELTMRPDVYNAHPDTLSTNPSLTFGSQWYFFRVQNTKRRTYRFHLGPFSHDVPALRRGMLPAMISEEAYKHSGVGWQRVGHNVVFEKNKQGSYTLSFSFHNATPKDILYFAFAPPYTYTQLQNMLYTLAKDAEVRQHFSVRPLCRTLAGNRCDVVTISENIAPKPAPPPADNDPGNSKARPSNPRASAINRAAAGFSTSNAPPVDTVDEEEAVVPDFLLKMQRLIQTEKHAKEAKQAEDSRKKVVFITARVHGGETASSWMCEGVIKFLLGGSPTAVELRKAVVFHIVPMLNPDGVVNGHSKRDIGGCDLNEHWDSPSPMLHSTVYHTKQLVKQSLLTGTLLAFFDLHGQATKDGVALYSVMPTPTEMQLYYQQVSKFHHAEKKDPNIPVSGVLDITKQADPRTYKLAAARRSPLVNLKCCAVKAGANKVGSARVVAAHEFHFPISMTVEASCHHSLVHKQHLAKQLVSTDYARFGCILLIALADVMGFGSSAVDAIKTEKLTRVRRASLAVSALSKFGSIRSGDDAIAGALAQVRLADANNSLGSDSESSVPFVSTAGPRQRPQKKDSFAIGSSARYTSGPSRASAELPQQQQQPEETEGTELDSALPVPKSSFAQVGEHTHYFSEEEVDPSDIKDPNLQLHFDEDIWETKSDTSDMEDPNPKVRPPTTSSAGRTAVSSVAPPLNEKIAWNLRRADELGLLEGMNRSGITLTLDQVAAQHRATFRDRVPKQAPAEASFEAKSVVHTAGPSHPHTSATLPSVGDDNGIAAKTPTRFARKHIINPDRMQSALVAAAQPPSPSPEAPPALTVAATPTAADSPRVNSPAQMEAGPGVQQGTARQQSYSSHAPKKGVIKVNLTRDPAATAAQGGLAGKALGESKGLVSFTVQVHQSTNEAGSSKCSQAPVSPVLKAATVRKEEDPDEKMGFDSDNDEANPTEVAFSEHMSVLANHVSRKVLTNDHHSAKKQVANTSAKLSASRKIKSDLASRIIEVPRSYSESVGNGDGSGQQAEQSTPGRSASVSPQHSEQPTEPAVVDPLVSAVSHAMDVITGALSDTPASDVGLNRSSSPLPFAPTTPLPVQGIDPLNNSMSPVFSLYTDTAPLYSERVSERIQHQQYQQQQLEQEQEIELSSPSRANTANRPQQRRLSTPLNTQTVSSAGYVRSATPPRSARSRLSGDGQSEKAAEITLPHVRHTTSEEVTQPHNAAIVFDDVLGDEPGPASLKHQHYVPYLNLSNSATLSAHSDPPSTRQKTVQPSVPPPQRSLRIAVPPIDTRPIDTKPVDTKLSAQEREREAMQAKFLHDMGLDYNRLFGPGGIMRAPAERKKNIKLHRSQEAAPTMSPAEIAGADGLFSSAFPLRRAVYEKEVVQLRPAEAVATPAAPGEVAPVLVRQGHKGVAAIRAPQQDRVYLRHQLDQYYRHVEDSLRERQLVEESSTAITARKVFEMVHQINLLDEREIARMELQDTIRRKWLARGGKWKHKNKHRPNKQPQPDPASEEPQEAQDTLGRMTAVTPRTYGALRNSLKSHGSAEGSILQDYQEYIGGADGDEGNSWQWLTAASPFPVAPSKSPVNANGKDNVSIPSAQVTGDHGNRDDVDTPFLGEEGGAASEDRKTPSVIFQIDATVKVKKKAVQIVQAHLGIDLEEESKASRVSTKAGGMDVFLDPTEGVSYTHSQELHDTMYQSVLDSIAEAQKQGIPPKLKGFYHNGLYYRYPQGPAQHSPRRLCSPPRARIDFFGGRGSHNTDNTNASMSTSAGHQDKHEGLHSPGADHKVGLDVVKPHRKLVDVTVVPTMTTEDNEPDLNCASGDMEFEDDLADAPGITVSAGPEVHHIHSHTAEPAHDPALPMHRIDSEYARYLRHGEIYRRSIIAGVDHEQPASLHASGHTLPSALATAPEAVASLKSNPLLQQRLNAISAARQRQEQRAAFDVDAGDSVELLARTIRQTIGVQNLQLEASVHRGVAVEPKTITPRRQLKEKRPVDTPVSIVTKDTGPFSVAPKVLNTAAPSVQKDSPQRNPRRPTQPVPSSPSFTANSEARYVLG